MKNNNFYTTVILNFGHNKAVKAVTEVYFERFNKMNFGFQYFHEDLLKL